MAPGTKSMKCWTTLLGGSESGDSAGKTSAKSWRKDGKSLTLLTGSFVRTWIAQTGASLSTPLRNWRVMTIPRNWVGAACAVGAVAGVTVSVVCGMKGCHTCLLPPK